jgi:TRAP-type mannitol/chloroaromatic compound transport system permease large subunit
MGLILERSGMAEDLLETVGQLFGTVRGGLAYAVIFVGALLAATTGVVAASVISMGLISLPIMLRYGYDARFASGTIAASGTLAQIIPPSLVLIVLADQLGRSVGEMYTGALLPGLMLAGFYALFAFIVSLVWKEAAPGLPPEAIKHREPDGSRGYASLVALTAICGAIAWFMMRRTSYAGGDLIILTLALTVCLAIVFASMNWVARRAGGPRLLSALAEQVVFVMVPPLLLIFLVLGTIFIGVATPTEGGAMGAVGAMLLALGKRLSEGKNTRFGYDNVRSSTQATAKLTE